MWLFSLFTAITFAVNSGPVFTVPEPLYTYVLDIASFMLTVNALRPDVPLVLIFNHFLSPPKKPSSINPRAIRATAAYTSSRYSEWGITGGR